MGLMPSIYDLKNVCVCVCAILCLQVPWRAEGIGAPGARAIGDVELSNTDSGTEDDPL